ncbi:MAG TPA: hypothetical protein VLH79_00215 [Chthonomonadales bacterium]|nr:hypothetical protein [Chthonomonadales bacterium]
MHLRTLVALAGGCVVLLAPVVPSDAQGQAPFTIRRPPDGARVRGDVRIQVPLASIPEGAYVAYSINGRFRAAIAPTAEQRARAGRGDTFDFVWDTREPVREQGRTAESAPADGEHTVSASLYVPRAGAAGGSELRQTSSVRLIVSNQITDRTGPVTLRYRFRDGMRREYARSSELTLVGGLSGMGSGVGEMEVSGLRSRLQLSVEDMYADGDAMLRNRLERLSVRFGGQETTFSSADLPGGVYKQVSSLGRIEYQNRPSELDQFAASGLKVLTAVELPILRSAPVAVGDSWQTPNVSLEIPGIAAEDQPRVTVTSRFEGFEWEGGFPTARIVETFDSTRTALNRRQLQVGPYLLENPQVRLTREIFLAHEHGTLVKVVRRLEVTGRAPMMQGVAVMGGAGIGGGMAPGTSGMMMGGQAGMSMPGMSGAPMSGADGMAMPGGGLFPGSGARARGGRAARMGAMQGSSAMAGPTAGMRRGAAGAMAGMRGPMMGGTTGPPQLTLRATTVTELAPAVAQDRAGRTGS